MLWIRNKNKLTLIWHYTVDFKHSTVISGTGQVRRHTEVRAPVYATYGVYIHY